VDTRRQVSLVEVDTDANRLSQVRDRSIPAVSVQGRQVVDEFVGALPPQRWRFLDRIAPPRPTARPPPAPCRSGQALELEPVAPTRIPLAGCSRRRRP
jgi:thioredoxin-like negative regulator of GroEL